jgi:hypothetical protein
MAFAGINYMAVILAALAGFLLGGVWYGVLGQKWMAALGKSEEDIKAAGRGMPFLFALTLLAQLVMALILAGLVGHLGTGQVTAANGLISGAAVWLGFVATTLAVNHGYQGASWTLTAIDGGHWLAVLLVQGLIIGWLGVT